MKSGLGDGTGTLIQNVLPMIAVCNMLNHHNSCNFLTLEEVPDVNPLVESFRSGGRCCAAAAAWMVDEPALPLSPCFVIIAYGVNDYTRGYRLTPLRGVDLSRAAEAQHTSSLVSILLLLSYYS